MAVKTIFLKIAFISAESGIFNVSARRPKQPQSISMPLIITDKIARAKTIFKDASIREAVLCSNPTIMKNPSTNSSHGRYIAVRRAMISGNNWNSLSVRRNLTGSDIFASPANKKMTPIATLNVNDNIAATLSVLCHSYSCGSRNPVFIP